MSTFRLTSAGLAQAAQQGIPPLLIAVLVVVVIALLLWLLLGRPGIRANREEQEKMEARQERANAAMAAPAARIEPAAHIEPAVQIEPAAPAKVAEVPLVEREVPAAGQDNLEIIEGIGPKIASVLAAAGVVTFAQLAAMEPDKIKEILLAGGMRLADPASWPEQARLAASGDQAGLLALQDRLKAGRQA